MTIKEIAQLAGTSRGTVDRVVNHRGKVSPEVQERVERICKETNYVNKQSLQDRKQPGRAVDVGVIIASKNNSFFDLILQGMKSALQGKYRYSKIQLHVFPVRLFNDSDVMKALDALPKKVKLLIISAAENEAILERVDALRIPVISVSIDLHAKEKAGFVGCDFSNSGALAADMVNLLLKPGSKVQVFIGSYSHQGHRQRLEGFRSRLSSIAIPLRPIETFDDDNIGYQRTKEILSSEDPDILVYFGAGMVGGLNAVREKSGKRPRIITVDEIPEILEGLQNGLVDASISQHPFSQGKKCIDIAYRHLILGEKGCERIYVSNSILLQDSILPYDSKNKKEDM